MKSWKKEQKEGCITGLEGEKPCKNKVENDKKSSVQSCQVGEREREREKFEKGFQKVFESVKALFLKNLKHDVRLIEKQVQSIEPGRGSLNFLNKILIDRKSDWINRNSRKTAF